MRLLSLILLSILLISIVSAQTQTLGTYKQRLNVNLIQACENSTYSNITRITYPNSSFALNNQTVMTKIGTNYNYTFNLTSGLGQYLVYGICDENGVQTEWVYDLFITRTADKLETPNAIIYIFTLLLGIFLLVGFIIGAVKIPLNDVRNGEGVIIAVNWMKYAKMLCIVMASTSLMWITYMAYNIILGYTSFEGTAGYFYMIHRITFVLFIAVAVVTVILSLIRFVMDLNLQSHIEKGFKIR